jgi:hypothetical protein
VIATTVRDKVSKNLHWIIKDAAHEYLCILVVCGSSQEGESKGEMPWRHRVTFLRGEEVESRCKPI